MPNTLSGEPIGRLAMIKETTMGLSEFLKPDILIAMGAFAVGFSALFLSIWQAIQTRKHNRLSVQPHLRVDRLFGRVILSSTGLGPARIRTIQFRVDDEFCPGDEFCSLARAMEKLMLIGTGVSARVPRSGDVLRSGEEHVLLSFKNFEKESESGKQIHDALGRLGLYIEYESIYGDSEEIHESESYPGR